MNICMLAGNPLTFDGRVLRHAACLARAGHNVSLLGVIGPNDGDPALPILPGVRILRLDRRRQGLLPRFLWLSSALRRRLAAYAARLFGPFALPGAAELWVAPCAVELLAMALCIDADVYHANDLDTLVPAAWAARLRRRHYIYDAHELYADESPWLGEKERAARFRVEKALIGAALATLTVSDLLADELACRYGATRPAVVRNVPATVPLLPRHASAVPRPLRLLLHGAWVGLEQPGVETALLAVAALPAATLTLRGGVRDEQALTKRIQSLNLSGRVLRQPRLSGAEALVAAAICEEHDIGLSVHLPDCLSRNLATSSKVFEYLMAGLCVVASDAPGNRHIFTELARTGEDPKAPPIGLLYPPGDAAALAACLSALYADAPRLLAMQQAARRVAEHSLCWEREQARLLSLYERP